jgi:hypothetical protein
LLASAEGFLLRNVQTTTILAAQQSPDGNSQNNEGVPPAPDLSWLKLAMDSPVSPEPDGLVRLSAAPGISGFAVDRELGFVVILTGSRERATYTVVSNKDKQQVRSAEALCLVQLAGGLDLGTPILPPDVLAKLVAEQIDGNVHELRPQVKLLQVDVVANEKDATERERIGLPRNSGIQSTPERDANIQSQSPKVFNAVRKLPGLMDCSVEDVVGALKVHADDSGQLDQQAFNAFLDTLRSIVNETEPSIVKFLLVVEVNGNEMIIPAPSTVVAIGLALRYKVDVVVSEECQVEGFDVVEIASRFPAFRPIAELYEDAKIMDGFIPSMFKQAAAPDNDDKM